MLPEYTPEFLARFWSRVDRSRPEGCWPWLGSDNGRGYGEVRYRGKKHYAHRIAYVATHGPIDEGNEVLHSCDNPVCCYPGHLTQGTHKQNMAEASERRRTGAAVRPDRILRGERHGSAKLTAQDVIAIRRRYHEQGVSSVTLAREYGMNPEYMSRVVNGHSWRHLNKE